MAIKDLLAIVDTGDKDEQFIKDALSFAEFHGAQLTFLVLSVIPSSDYAGVWGAPYVILQDFVELVETKKKRLAERTRLSNIEVRAISDQPGVMLTKAAVEARYADMVLFGPADTYEYPPVRRETIESILFASGRPVLILPTGHQPRAFDHIALGWNASREATHALKDATGLAVSNAKVDILVLDGRPSTKGHGSDPGADIAHHLARHGFATNVVTLTGLEKSDAETLIQGARQHGANLLALGAYGHSRLREMILGGVTRELIAGAPIPVLFSH